MGVFRTAVTGEPTYANAQLLEWVNCSFDEFRRGEWLSRVHPDDVPAALQAMKRTFGKPVRFDEEFRVYVRGEVHWLRLQTQPLLDEHGAVVGHVGSVVDSTPARHAEAERARLQAQLEQARRMESLGLLAGGIAHDFNNLLVGMLANASHAREIMEREDPLREMLDDIVRSAQRAGELTRQLLAYAGRSRTERKPVALAPLVRELPLLLGARIPPSVRVEFEAGESPVVNGDETQLRQVVLNLVTNAVDAMHGKSGVVSIRVARGPMSAADLGTCLLGAERTPGPYAVVTVGDTGSGMSREVQERMFDPFFSTKHTGRGLGLAATLGIVQAHDGAIDVRSREGMGTTIRLLLPESDVPLEPVRDLPVSFGEATGRGSVLLVDDDDGARSAARRILVRAGFTVEEATNGQEALDRYAAMCTPPCLIVLDLSMPVMGGAECLTRLRTDGVCTPVLIVSGFDPDDMAGTLVERGEALFLRKPYSVSELLQALQTVLV